MVPVPMTTSYILGLVVLAIIAVGVPIVFGLCVRACMRADEEDQYAAGLLMIGVSFICIILWMFSLMPLILNLVEIHKIYFT